MLSTMIVRHRNVLQQWLWTLNLVLLLISVSDRGFPCPIYETIMLLSAMYQHLEWHGGVNTACLLGFL